MVARGNEKLKTYSKLRPSRFAAGKKSNKSQPPLGMGVWPRRAYAPKSSFHRTLFAVNRGQGRITFFSLFYVSSNFKTQLFSKIDGHFLGTSCFVIANLGRLVAAKMRLSINCIEFAYSRPIVYPRPCLIETQPRFWVAEERSFNLIDGAHVECGLMVS